MGRFSSSCIILGKTQQIFRLREHLVSKFDNCLSLGARFCHHQIQSLLLLLVAYVGYYFNFHFPGWMCFCIWYLFDQISAWVFLIQVFLYAGFYCIKTLKSFNLHITTKNGPKNASVPEEKKANTNLAR